MFMSPLLQFWSVLNITCLVRLGTEDQEKMMRHPPSPN